MSAVIVVDYGLGNLLSVTRALEAAGAKARLSSTPEEVASAERLVLPGVGAFGDGMRGLRERGLIQPIRAFAATGRPLLGICLGMQLLLSEGTEFGAHEGLGLVPGKVVRLEPAAADGSSWKLPHVGWSPIRLAASSWEGSLLAPVRPGAEVYFVHSYVSVPERAGDVLARSAFAGRDFCSALRRDNVAGCQFHPEKSGQAGVAMLSQFLRL